MRLVVLGSYPFALGFRTIVVMMCLRLRGNEVWLHQCTGREMIRQKCYTRMGEDIPQTRHLPSGRDVSH